MFITLIKDFFVVVVVVYKTRAQSSESNFFSYSGLYQTEVDGDINTVNLADVSSVRPSRCSTSANHLSVDAIQCWTLFTPLQINTSSYRGYNLRQTVDTLHLVHTFSHFHFVSLIVAPTPPPQTMLERSEQITKDKSTIIMQHCTRGEGGRGDF